MIITIAGTSGAGKSHLMRAILDWLKEMAAPEEEFIPGRVSPIGYRFPVKKHLGADLFVCGAYEVPTGGCDGISSVSQVFELVSEKYAEGLHVLYEGLFVMNMTRGPQLAAEVGKNLVVLQLSTPLATCFESITTRRAAKGKEALTDLENVKGNYNRALNYCAKMRDAGARVFRVSREEALDKVMELLEGGN